MRVIGLTGGIATGKSTVARHLVARGAAVVDADVAAREVVRPGQPALAEIIERFGSAVISPDGTLDRAGLGAIVFADPGARADLDSIIHPRIRAVMADRIADAVAGPAPLVVVDIPLLFESGRDGEFEGVLFVYTDEGTQLERLIGRDGLGRDAAAQRVAAQLPMAAKRARATWIIDNSGSAAATQRQVDEWWQDNVKSG